MIKKEELFKIGVLNKPHGIHGEISFTFTDDIFDRVEVGFLICLLDGIFVPFFIENYRFKSDTTALVKFQDIDSAEKARKFTNVEIYFPLEHREESAPAEISWDALIGFEAWEAGLTRLGKINAVDTSTINILLVIDFDGNELLVPAREEFIVELDPEKRKITFNLPRGLVHMDEAERVD